MRVEGLVWTCEVCEKPISNGAGYLTVHHGELHAYDRAAAAWEEEHQGWIHSGEVFVSYPHAVRWQVVHAHCDPQPNSADDYWIAVERIRTPEQVIRWASHLLEKGWIRNTDWGDVLRGVAGQLREREGEL